MVLLIGETISAREISANLLDREIKHVRVLPKDQSAVLIKPGGELLAAGPYEEIRNWLEGHDCRAVIDAGHPATVSKLISFRYFCELNGIPYARLERPETKLPPSQLVHVASSWNDALDCLLERVSAISREGHRPTVFITTGSHQLESLTAHPVAERSRLVVRVLPEGRLVQKCQELGIPPRDIVALQGPFSKEINRSLFKFYGADILLTRDSGAAGGTDTKLSAALALNMEVVLLKRTGTAAGLSLHSAREVITWLNKILVK